MLDVYRNQSSVCWKNACAALCKKLCIVGRGAVDFKISRGSKDKTLVEFKLAKNTQLKRNLKNQVKIYESPLHRWRKEFKLRLTVNSPFCLA